MRRTILTAIALALAALPAHAARFQFCWIGNAGYTMEGIIEVPQRLLNTGIITEQDVTAFFIQGYHDGVPIGSWNMRQRTTETTWTLFFDTTNLEFPMGGHFLEQSYQAWNANGEVNDCGIGGFGFNGGNWAQDVCIDNVWIAASSIDPDTPLPVFGMGTEMSCQSVVPLS
ncbi:hypothetical protein roselon_01141 [Roseibacterium elongatum DSM 19469]|uniref:Uncharacterized protein n=1 Tax=Roseicyclus elongatus DSM 19469 TaxID=1294273 RepID=W8S423_9RHOB|nr:hypothetical protein [Roseibacterium elongatum]AHM03536.1 hypothetical protein roselon_01141 [Roseibacterium elongatum DSM 19469]